jgi:hypothetical protein
MLGAQKRLTDSRGCGRMIALGGQSHFPRVKGRCEMIRQPTKELSVSVRSTSVIPWIGGAVVLAIGLVIVSSSGQRKDSAALTPPPDAARGRDLVAQAVADPQRTSKPNQPVAPAVVVVTAGDAPSLKSSTDTSSLKSPPATEEAPSTLEPRAPSNPKRDDNVQPASAVAPAPSSPSPTAPSAPATVESNTSAPSAVASSPGTVNSRGYYRMRWRRRRRVSLSLPAEREPVERIVV